MKKLLSAVLVAILAVGLLGGCSEKYAESDYCGTYIATNGEKNGITVRIKDAIGETTLILKPNGKATVQTDLETLEGKWEPLEDKDAQLTIEEKTFHIIREDKNTIQLSKDNLIIYFDEK